MQKTLAYSGMTLTALGVLVGWGMLLSRLPVENAKGAMMLGIVIAVFNGIAALAWIAVGAASRRRIPVLVAGALLVNAVLSWYTMHAATSANDESTVPPSRAPVE